MTDQPSIYSLVPVHNRKSVTLRCLAALDRQVDLPKLTIVVIDDGSTDGTSEAIQAEYPQVVVLKGSGNLWWTGAIRMGMEYAYSQGANFFIWLNDDTLPSPETLSLLIHHCSSGVKCIATAQCYASEHFKKPTYGGQLKHLLSLELFATPQGQKLRVIV